MPKVDPFMLTKRLSQEDADFDLKECGWEDVEEAQGRVFEWENSRFTIRLQSGPTQFSEAARRKFKWLPTWDECVPRVECTSKRTPFELLALCASKSDEAPKPVLCVMAADKAGMFYTPEEAPDAVRVIADEALYAAEACRFVQAKVEELYPGAELFDSREDLGMRSEGIAGSFDDFSLCEQASGEGWSRMVWKNSRFIVGFYELGEGLLHIERTKVDPDEKCPSPTIVARPQLIGSYLEPLLFIDLTPRLWRIETAEQDMKRLIAETEVAVGICKFMREQVARHYPEYIL